MKSHGRLLDYSLGRVSITAPNPFSSRFPDAKGKDFVAVVPLDRFVHAFGLCKKMATTLEEKGEGIIEIWKAKNGDKRKAGDRSSVDRVYPLYLHEFVSSRGMPENSGHELWLNTHSFTADNMFATVPRQMQLENVRVNIFYRISEIIKNSPIFFGAQLLCMITRWKISIRV
jgi:hypothetical protein